jgi:hypothetical protein
VATGLSRSNCPRRGLGRGARERRRWRTCDARQCIVLQRGCACSCAIQPRLGSPAVKVGSVRRACVVRLDAGWPETRSAWRAGGGGVHLRASDVRACVGDGVLCVLVPSVWLQKLSFHSCSRRARQRCQSGTFRFDASCQRYHHEMGLETIMLVGTGFGILLAATLSTK